MKLISVIIPCFDSEAFVERAIQSVLKQTYTNYEIILVDNGSTDNTLAILSAFAQRYPEKIRMFHEDKKGAPAARNKGLSEARGEWIQFLDSDDELLPQKLENQIGHINDAGPDIIVGPCFKHKPEGKKVFKWIQKTERKDVWKGLLTSRLGNTSANLWKTRALFSVSGWNESMSSSQEYDLLFRLLKNNAVVSFSSVPLLIRHIRNNSVARSPDSERVCEILNNYVQLRIKIREYLREHGKLTKDLKSATDRSIYARLAPYKRKVPNFYSKILCEMRVKVPLSFKIKLRLKKYSHQLRQA